MNLDVGWSRPRGAFVAAIALRLRPRYQVLLNGPLG